MLKKFEVKNTNLAPEGQSAIRWAEAHMPVLMRIRARFQKERPLKGVQIGATLHVTKETAVLIRTLAMGGAEVALSGSNPLSTQDEVAAALVEDGVHVYAWRGQTSEDYYNCINNVIEHSPRIIHDDGADTITIIHEKTPHQVKDVIIALEETTTGVVRLKAMEKQGNL
ncbi:adenosylhomocysteinase, partial [Candidatus Bathyarchaeota archaeon]|nr:adenosylhomocysteinase [Candidatus Bathyarchaeota archaeon]